jgi:hypothetical protein
MDDRFSCALHLLSPLQDIHHDKRSQVLNSSTGQ